MQRHHPVELRAELVKQLAHGPEPGRRVVGQVRPQPHPAPRATAASCRRRCRRGNAPRPSGPTPGVGRARGVDDAEHLLHPRPVDLDEPGRSRRSRPGAAGDQTFDRGAHRGPGTRHFLRRRTQATTGQNPVSAVPRGTSPISVTYCSGGVSAPYSPRIASPAAPRNARRHSRCCASCHLRVGAPRQRGTVSTAQGATCARWRAVLPTRSRPAARPGGSHHEGVAAVSSSAARTCSTTGPAARPPSDLAPSTIPGSPASGPGTAAARSAPPGGRSPGGPARRRAPAPRSPPPGSPRSPERGRTPCATPRGPARCRRAPPAGGGSVRVLGGTNRQGNRLLRATASAVSPSSRRIIRECRLRPSTSRSACAALGKAADLDTGHARSAMASSASWPVVRREHICFEPPAQPSRRPRSSPPPKSARRGRPTNTGTA